MSLSPGTRLGSYEIVSPLGAGGMGEVYRARDARLGRDVAIKVLPPHVADSADARHRFEREARALAALSHPHICPVYDVGRQDDVDFLVMELLEGEPLSDRLSKGPLAIDQALRYAIEIADALDKAHRQGIVHRDLKPGNVIVTRNGGAKLLDFGLAKLAPTPGAAPGVAGLSMLPTTPPNLTVQGTILGTFQYMAPEQLEGGEADARTDIFAFGAVLYEMVTGRKAFEGKSQASLISAIMSGDPAPISALQPVAPAALDQLVRTCLAKDPDERWQTAGDVERQLKWIVSQRSQPSAVAGVAPRRRSSRVFEIAAGTAIAAAAVTAGAAWLLTRPEPARAQRLSIVTPPEHPLATGGTPSSMIAMSPDGRDIAYVGQNLLAGRSAGQRQLYLRSLATREVRALPGSEDATQPFFSPDGQWVAFFTSGSELKKSAVQGGRSLTIASDVTGATWGFGIWLPDNTIVYGTPSTGGLRRIPADGGTATQVTTLGEGELVHVPTSLADDDTVLMSVASGTRYSAIEAVGLATGDRRRILDDAGGAYLPGGYLLIDRDRAVLVAPFDAGTGRVTGDAFPFVDDVARDSATFDGLVPQIAISREGTIAYVPGGDATRSLGRVTRSGAFEALVQEPGGYTRPRFSPDGRFAVVEIAQGENDNQLHLYDVERGTMTKLTRGGVNQGAAWRPDSRAVAVFADTPQGRTITLFDVRGGEQPLLTVESGHWVRPGTWTPDGKELVYALQDNTQHDLWALPVGTGTAAPRQLTRTPASEYAPQLSPSGQWLAYASNESGRPQVYLRRYPDGERFVVSTGTTQGPVWSRDGRELYYMGEHAEGLSMMAVSVTPADGSIRLGAPQRLFGLRVPGPLGVMQQYTYGPANFGATYDVLPDGRFLMVAGPDPQGRREIVVIQNFLEEVRRLAPAR